MRRALVVAALAAAAALPTDALAARWAVGAQPGKFGAVAAQLPGARTLVPGRALLVRGPRPHVRGASYVMRLDGAKRKLSFANTEPFHDRQWYLPQDRAWDFWRQQQPDLPTVKVAVVDTGVDYGHPDLAGRIVGGKSFVKGTWRHDTAGHGTFVAGLIAADPFNGVGIAGLGFNVKLLIAKVSEPDGVSLEAESEGIVWAANNGARVINLSIGGQRVPNDPRADTFSPLEADAVRYAYSKGVVVVSAVGNGPDSPATPWPYADWPSSLPHVIGVAALRQDGSVPLFSNRDPFFVDMAAPGEDIFSTIPRNLIDQTQVGCDEPYSDCGSATYRNSEGTSFAAPQVSAAAALLIGLDPTLKPDQVAWLLERSATDVTSAHCTKCRDGRDSLTGWGRLNVLAAIQALQGKKVIPPPDAYEPNDDAGPDARAFGPPRTITATLDYWDDPTDVYSIKLAEGETLTATLQSSLPVGRMQLWAPGTTGVGDQRGTLSKQSGAGTARGQQISFRAPVAGTYFLDVRAGKPARDRPVYELAIEKTRG